MTLNNLNIAIYARYSSDNQHESSIDDQVRVCREYILKSGGRFDNSLVFTDYAVSGGSLARSGFEAMMSLVSRKPRGIDCIVSWSLSRVTRDFADGAQLYKQLQYYGVRLVGITDGIDTVAKNGKLMFGVKNLMDDMAREELSALTKRGLERQALGGRSTGGWPLGYRSRPLMGINGEVIGYRIEIDAERAKIVIWIFERCVEGKSLRKIACELNRRGIASPRAKTKHRDKGGWSAETIRAMLHNEKYIGVWRYNETEWLKKPGTNIRTPRRRQESEVISRRREDLRIVDQKLWDAVQARLRAVSEKYARNGEAGTPNGRTRHRRSGGGAALRQTTYPLSGLLSCGMCGGSMVILGGSGTRYYRCRRSRTGECENRRSVREDVARRSILSAIRDKVFSREAVAFAKKCIEEAVRALGRERGDALVQANSRLTAAQARLYRLVQAIADGTAGGSEIVKSERQRFEAEIKEAKAKIAQLAVRSTDVSKRPRTEEVMARCRNVDLMVREEPDAGREALRKLLKDRKIVLQPRDDGTFVADCDLFSSLVLAP